MQLAAILLSLMLMQNQAPAVPALVHDGDYPLRVQVAELGSSTHGLGKLSGYGHGNLLGPPVEGFDYTEDCNQRFARQPTGDQYFRARWTKPKQKLEILIQELGSDRVTRCELKVAMQEEAYELNPTRTVRLGSMQPGPRPAVPVTEPDPNFPLRLQLWVTSAGFGSLQAAHAEGYGNVIGPPAQGFDFANECPVRLSRGIGNTDVYQARWIEPGLQLEILLQEVGTRQQHVCEMDIGMKAAPYPAPRVGTRPVAPLAPVETTKPKGPQAPTVNSDIPPQ